MQGKDKTNTGLEHNGWATGPDAPVRQPADSGPNQGDDLVYRLKNAIDQRGRYSFRLNDMAAGLAAAQGVTLPVARRQIEEEFAQKIGVPPQRYLDDHYAQRKQEARNHDRDQDRRSMDRGR